MKTKLTMKSQPGRNGFCFPKQWGMSVNGYENSEKLALIFGMVEQSCSL